MVKLPFSVATVLAFGLVLASSNCDICDQCDDNSGNGNGAMAAEEADPRPGEEPALL